MAPLNSRLKVKVQVKLHCKSATRYQITGQGGCSEEIVPWPLGRSSCQGNGHVAPGAQGRNSAVPGGGTCGGAQHPRLCAGRTARGLHTSRRIVPVRPGGDRSSSRRAKLAPSFPPMSLCITTGQHRPFALEQRFPNPVPWTGTPVRNWATQLEVRLV